MQHHRRRGDLASELSRRPPGWSAGMHLGLAWVLSTAWLVRPPLHAGRESAQLHAARGFSRRAPTPVAKTIEHLFNATDSTLSFGCRQKSVTVVRPEAAGTLSEFMLTQADNVLVNSWGDGVVTPLGDGEFLIESAQLAPPFPPRRPPARAPAPPCVAVPPFDFLSLHSRVTLRARVWVDESTNTVHLRSTPHEVTGLSDFLGTDKPLEAIRVVVRASLRPTPPTSKLCALSGNVGFDASGAMPAVLRAAPDNALRTAARLLCDAIMLAASDRFEKGVPEAYRAWALAQRT